MSKWVEGYITQVNNWTSSLFSLKIKADIQPFEAGQFTQLSLCINNDYIQRPYSFVNPPNSDLLEFYITRIEQGKLSSHLQQLGLGDCLRIGALAKGYFVLNEIPDCNQLWMIATGTGIAPYLSMLQQKINLDRFDYIVLVHAVRYRKDFCYLPVIKKLQKHYSKRLIIQTITSGEWDENSLQGRIPQLIYNGQLENAVGLAITRKKSHVMLCGNPLMVNDSITVLKQRHLLRHSRRNPGHITSERYW